MKTIKKENIEVQYKPLNIPQALRLMSKLGIDQNGLSDKTNLLDLLADFIDEAKEIVKTVKIDDKTVKWDNFINNPASMDIFGVLLNEIIGGFSGGAPELKNA